MVSLCTVFKAEQAKLVKTSGQTSEGQEVTDGGGVSGIASAAPGSQVELRIRMPDGQVGSLYTNCSPFLASLKGKRRN